MTRGWRPRLAAHALLPIRVRQEICAALALAVDEHVRGPRYPQCELYRLPPEMLYVVCEFIAARPARDYSLDVEPGVFRGRSWRALRGVTVTPDDQIVVSSEERMWLLTLAGEERSVPHGGMEGLAYRNYKGHGQIICANHRRDNVHVLSETGELIQIIGGVGSGPGQFVGASGVAVDDHGNIVVADTCNERVQILSPDGVPLKQFGISGKADGQFSQLGGVTVGLNGDIVVADTLNHRLQVFRPDGTFVRCFGRNIRPPLRNPQSVAVDADGNMVVADTGHNRVVVLSAVDGSLLYEVGGWGRQQGSFDMPWAVAVMYDGTIVVVDMDNNRIQFI